jgi:hypothetical protein
MMNWTIQEHDMNELLLFINGLLLGFCIVTQSLLIQTVWQVFITLNVYPSCSRKTTLLDNPMEMEYYVFAKICEQMLTVAII